MALRRLGATQCFFFPLSLPCNFPRLHSLSLDGKMQLEQNESSEMDLNEPSARGGRLREKIRDY